MTTESWLSRTPLALHIPLVLCIASCASPGSRDQSSGLEATAGKMSVDAGFGGAFGDAGACEGTAGARAVEDPMIADFENGEVSWYDYFAGESANVSIRPDSPGAAGTQYALNFVASDLVEWGAGTGTFFGCTRVNAFSGVAFYAKGTAGEEDSLSLAALTPEELPARYGGDCVGTCQRYPYVRFQLTPQWQPYYFDWSEFVARDEEIRIENSTIVGFNVTSGVPSAEFAIDELQFAHSLPTAGASGAGGAGGLGEGGETRAGAGGTAF